MLDLYFWPTPNGYKISIMLEELEYPYQVIPVHIGKGQQFAPEFLAISPNNKIPALVDPDGPDGSPITLFESGAILLYLSEKSGGRFIPKNDHGRYGAMQWLMFQMGSLGPMLGQVHHFRQYAPTQIEYAVTRYTNEAARLYRVLDARLSQSQYLAGDEYTIADIATYPWIRPYKLQGQDVSQYPNLQRWYNDVRSRPAVQRGLAVLAEKVSKPGNAPTGERWNNLFGTTQFVENHGRGN